MVRTAGWTTNPSELNDIVDVLAEALEEDDLDFVYSLSDALLFHNLDTYPAFYRATFEVFMARSQPDDSDPDAKERLLTAKSLLEEDDRMSKELWGTSEPRVGRMLKQVNECLQNDLVECPPPGHPDRRETQKVYLGLREPDEEDDEDNEMEYKDAEMEEANVEQSPDAKGDPPSAVQADIEPELDQSAGDTAEKATEPVEQPDPISLTAGAGHEAHNGSTSSTTAAKKQGEDTAQKSKARKKLPSSIRMKRANKDFSARAGLGGTVESGKARPSKRAVQDLFDAQLDGTDSNLGAGSGEAEATGGQGRVAEGAEDAGDSEAA